jgi:hypothetical protein
VLRTPGGPFGLAGSAAKLPGGPELEASAAKTPGGPHFSELSLRLMEATKKLASAQNMVSAEAKTPGGAEPRDPLERGDTSASLSKSASDIAAQESAPSTEMPLGLLLAAVDAVSLTSLAASQSFSATGASSWTQRMGGCDMARRREPQQGSNSSSSSQKVFLATICMQAMIPRYCK